MEQQFLVRDLESAQYAVWNELVAAAPEGSTYVTSDYLQILAQVTGASIRIVGVFRDQELVGGIALYETQAMASTGFVPRPHLRLWRTPPNDTPKGKRLLASGRYLLYYNGPCVKSLSTASNYRRERWREHVLDVIEGWLRASCYTEIRFKVRSPEADYRTFLAHGWRVRPVYSYQVDLTDLAALWRRMDHNLRRLVGRCIAQGMYTSEHGQADEFYRAHQALHDRKGSPLYLPSTSFCSLIDRLHDQQLGRLFAVHDANGKALAWQLVLLGAHPVAHILAANGLEEHQHTGCNALLRWQVCEWLAQRHYQGLDLTDAHYAPVARFKSQLGAELQIGWQIERPLSPTAELAAAANRFVRHFAKRVLRRGSAE